MSRVETGKLTPSPQQLVSLANVYGVPAHSFLDLFEIEALRAYAPRTDDPVECKRLGRESLDRGDFQTSIACGMRGLEILSEVHGEQSDERRDLAFALRNNLGIALLRLGKYRLAQHHLETALEVRGVSDIQMAMALTNLSLVAYQLDRLPIADALAFEALKLARRAGAHAGAAMVLIHLASVRTDLGKAREALALFRRSLAIYEAIGGHETEKVCCHIDIGDSLADLGHDEEALESYGKALDLAENQTNKVLKCKTLGNLGRLFHRTGRLDEARAPLAEARSIGIECGYPSETFQSTYYLWRIAIERKVGSEAMELFKALKQLRLRLDQRTEEVVSFDEYVRQFRMRKRRKGAAHGSLTEPDDPSFSPRLRSRIHARGISD